MAVCSWGRGALRKLLKLLSGTNETILDVLWGGLNLLRVELIRAVEYSLDEVFKNLGSGRQGCRLDWPGLQRFL